MNYWLILVCYHFQQNNNPIVIYSVLIIVYTILQNYCIKVLKTNYIEIASCHIRVILHFLYKTARNKKIT